MLQPFVTLEKSRNDSQYGHGFGLAIVNKIMQWHGGQCHIAESPIGGTRVSLFFKAD